MDGLLTQVARPEGEYSRQNLGGSERVVMGTLGMDVDATDGGNSNTFKRMNNETGEFTYDEVVVWFRMLSKRGKCQGLAKAWRTVRRNTRSGSSQKAR